MLTGTQKNQISFHFPALACTADSVCLSLSSCLGSRGKFFDEIKCAHVHFWPLSWSEFALFATPPMFSPSLLSVCRVTILHLLCDIGCAQRHGGGVITICERVYVSVAIRPVVNDHNGSPITWFLDHTKLFM